MIDSDQKQKIGNYEYKSKLCIFSYNSTGFGICKQNMIQTLMTIAGNKIPIICNQENFVLNGNGYFFKKAFPFSFFVKL